MSLSDVISFFDHGMGTLTPQRPIPPCRWDRFDLICVHEGQLRLSFAQRRTLNLNPAAGVLIYPDTPFEGEAVPAGCDAAGICRISVQHFALDAHGAPYALPTPLRRLVDKREGFEPIWISHYPDTWCDIRRSLELAFEPQDATVHDLRVALLTLVIGRLENRPLTQLSQSGQYWERFGPWLRQQLHRRVSLSEMAEQVGLSKDHFRHRFRVLFGVPPGRYLQSLRLEEAQRLLRETDLPIKNISQRVGYGDLPNFYRSFRTALGSTPATYRDHHSLRG